jgi:iron complex outermembrane receptor protein
VKYILSGIFILIFNFSFAQAQDSIVVLAPVKVKAFEAQRSITEVAAAVNVIEPKAIARFDNNGILPILNLYPGVAMEERSPGSYRISIRGSSVRSPFGVRNVKVYWNEIPFTDANGVSYFNLLDINSLQSIEILKGPSASIYGAGMGGVILLDSKSGKVNRDKRNSLGINTHFGSYNTQNRSINYTSASAKSNTYLGYSHAGTNGFREHSKFRRDVFNYRTSLYLTDKYTLHLNSFYADIFYQTPGGLNIAQRSENPQLARQSTRFTPSSEEQKAAIYQKLFSLGVSQEIKLTDRISSSISLFGNSTNLQNPFITNYEKRNQKSFGARSKNILVLSEGQMKTKAVLGFEYQKTNSTFDVFDNNKGVTGKTQFQEKVDAFQSSLFAQIEAELPNHLFFTAGLSLNKQLYTYEILGGLKVSSETSGVPLMPRISVLRSFNSAFSAFASVSRGFSPPTVQEFVTIFHPLVNISRLNAETGINYEIGIKGQSKGFSYQANAYSLLMNNAIIRGNVGEEDVYSNAGKASQNGLEILVEYQKGWTNNSNLHLLFSADFKDYTYLEFTDKAVVFDGKLIPSVPKKTFNAALDYQIQNGLFWNNNFNFTDEIPLNNANTVFANSYFLLSSRLGWRKEFEIINIKIYAGGENLLNQDYSLGNDINAFGSRYYNPSPKRNWNGGVSATFKF